MSTARVRSSVATASTILAATFLAVLVPALLQISFQDAFFWAAMVAVLVLLGACVVHSDPSFRSGAKVAGAAFLVPACAILFALWVDDDDSVATILVGFGGAVSFGMSWVFLWQHRRLEGEPGWLAHIVAGVPFVAPARALWILFE